MQIRRACREGRLDTETRTNEQALVSPDTLGHEENTLVVANQRVLESDDRSRNIKRVERVLTVLPVG